MNYHNTRSPLKSLYCLVIFCVVFTTYYGGNAPIVYAQGMVADIATWNSSNAPSGASEAIMTPIRTKISTLATSQDITSLSFPSFRWPWDASENGKVKWTSGPHSWSKGGQLTTKISSTRGSGLDFAKDGNSFNVLSMASGTVIKNQCGFIGLGCIVAIRHTAGNTIMIYAHLKSNANGTAPDNNLIIGTSYPQGTLIGSAGQTGGQTHIHLHIEFRDGASTCSAAENSIDGNDCGDIGWSGNPIGWDGRELVDNYYVNGYFDSDNFCGPGADCDTIFNYDGTAVLGTIAGPLINFPYIDNGISRHVLAFIHPDDFDFFNNCSLTTTNNNCEINTNKTVFADHGTFSGGGGILYSTNSQSQVNDTTPPTGSWSSPNNGQTISSRLVTLSVNASDNSGGSGIKEVRFSALWGGQWRGVGIDSSSPYSVNWDMCADGVPSGDVELGFEVWDNANNVWIYSQHYPNIHINKNYNCTVSNDTTPPTGSWTSPSNGQIISSQNVTLSVNASDNSGGSGVREVRWSAKWNNQWSGIGTDNTAPYSINWDMCAAGVPNGDVELGMEVWDNANNVWIYSQHYTNIHINKNYTCPTNGSGWETWGWQNAYLAGYDNWHGTVTWDNGYPYIWWDFGTGGPFGWGGDEFSLRMQRDVYFPGGDYSFHADHDDGVRVYVDGNLIIDAWWDGNGGHDAGRNISQGYHQVKVEYYERYGDALIHVLWYGPGYPRPDNNPPDGQITSPSNSSATSYSPLNVTADAWDDASGVDRVEFYVWYCSSSCDWHPIGTDYSSPYSVDWDWSALTDQHVYLTIHVIDKTGKVRDDPGGYVGVDLDRTSPTADIISPQEGDILSGIVPIQVDASDSLGGIGAVQFIVGYDENPGAGLQSMPKLPLPAIFNKNGVMATSNLTTQDWWKEIGWDYDGSDGWSFSWDTSNVPEQSGIAVFVYVYDKAGNYKGAVQWNMSLFRPPVNDDISTPILINSDPYLNQQNIYNATQALDDPGVSNCGGYSLNPGLASVWYRYTPGSNKSISIDTTGSDYDTYIAVWTGSRGNLSSVKCNDDSNGVLQSSLGFDAVAGISYYVEVAQWNGYSNGYSMMNSLKSKPSFPVQGDGNLYIHVREAVHVDTLIGGTVQGDYFIPMAGSTRQSYISVNNGPVQITNIFNNISIMGAARVIYKVNGTNTSYSEMMALPSSQLTTTYWLPWYNNVDLDTQLRIGNVSGTPAQVHVYIAGNEVNGSPFNLSATGNGQSLRLSFPNVNSGPVQIIADQNIVAAERVIYKINGTNTSYSEMMALPNSQLTTTYWLPWYNNVDLDTQLRIGNVSGTPAQVHVIINGQEVTGSPFNLSATGAGQSLRLSFPNINSGPVQIVADQNIVAAERVIYKINGTNTSFTEMMALPNSQLTTTYWLPWYNNVDLDTQLRIGNVSNATATVHIFIGGTEVTPVSGLTLLKGASTRVSYAGMNNGPVQIVSDQNIVAAERVIYKVNGLNTSFSEMMALPNSQLTTTYWLPWYNNVDLDTQLRFGVP